MAVYTLSPAPARLELVVKHMFNHVMQAEAGIYEGGASLAQIEHLRDVARRSGSTWIAEIGFNVGYSTIGFLESSPEARVVSFELDLRPCVKLAKEFIDERYPGRHELVVGDSQVTVPEFAEACRAGSQGFDLVFIDGSHMYDVAANDIRNSARIAAQQATVVVDDLTPWYLWGAGPTRAWQEAVDSERIEALEYVVDGRIVDRIEGPADRAWAVGRFR
ncbi:class I SAM-dependent methyltransferase [Actinospica robiniae]|uniref:class I SAM-dependent methyltransferase n=1 Tax=Actinospica robiniae TaxID=304901 RepID=UPI0004113EB8|nr:class I SAM-dependent methyltransferase [Actinospica robiniae]